MNPQPEQDDAQALQQARQRGYETRDANVKGVLLFGVVLMVMVAIALGLMYWLALVLVGPQLQRPPFAASPAAPAIFDRDIQANQRLLRLADKRVRQEVLESYAWIDRSQGIARIPVGRAMELLAGRKDMSLKFPEPEGEVPPNDQPPAGTP